MKQETKARSDAANLGPKVRRPLKFAILGVLVATTLCRADVAALDAAVQEALAALAQCESKDPLTPCNEFVCKAMQRVYGPTAAADLRGRDGKCLLANDIDDVLWATSSGAKASRAPMGWSYLGTAADSAALERAQACANEGYVTLVSSHGARHGHIVLVVPGALQASPSWSTNVPTVAGRREGIIGTKGESANGNQVLLSTHWSKADLATARIFAAGTHAPHVKASGCQ